MAELTNIESKLGEVIGLAMAAQAAGKKVRGLVDDRELKRQLDTMLQEAAEAEKRGKDVAGTFSGKKKAILDEARATKQKGANMMKIYLDRKSDGLDGFEFLTMGEAGEVGHWQVLGELGRQSGHREVRELVRWGLPIQRRHLKDVQAGTVKLAAQEDPDESS
jgi:hypothetical protein